MGPSRSDLDLRREHRDEVRCEFVADPERDLRSALAERIRTALRFKAEVQQVDRLPEDSPVLVDERTWQQER